MSDLIFGRTWEQIRRAQQGDSRALHESTAKQDAPEEMKAKLESEMARFGLHVNKDVADAYNVTIPASYKLDGDTYKPRSEASA